MIHLCDKMPDARSGFDLLLDTPFNEIVIVVHFGLESGLNFRWQYSLYKKGLTYTGRCIRIGIAIANIHIA